MTSASEEFARTTGQKTDNNRGRLVLFIGLALGVVAAILVALALSNDDGPPQTVQVPATRVAVSAVADIPARTRLTRDMLQVQTYNVADVDPDAFTAVSQVLNRVTATDITAGEVIIPSFVSTSTGEGLTFSVTEGMRAVSISVNEVVTAGGNISPGDRVDILGFFQLGEGSDVASIVEVFTGQPVQQTFEVTPEATLTFTLLQHVRILAVAQDLPPDVAEPSSDAEEAGAIAERETEANQANPRASTVTLEVTPQQAQALATADLLGTLRLSLRPFGEDDVAEVIPIVVLLD
jgi:pilus assembly protein CpaB